MSEFGEKEGFELFAVGREELDVSDFEALEKMFHDISPDVVINCVAYTKVDQAETEREAAVLLNAELPGVLMELCKRCNATLIHFSTEYVFNGENEQGYSEENIYSPINFYGESKMLGEKAVMEGGGKFYLIRTSWLFGPNGKNFVDTMVGLIKSRDELSVVTDQVGSPTYSVDLACAVIDNFLSVTPPSPGIYHLTNSEVCSRYEWVEEMVNIIGRKIELNGVTSDAFPLPAKRPACSILLNTKLPAIRSWKLALEAYIKLHF